MSSKIIQLELGPKAKNCDLDNIQTLQKLIEEQTGILTVVKGFGSLNSAVAELRPPNKVIDGGKQVMGIVRMSQLADNHCFFDGLIDGFTPSLLPGRYSIAIHKFGDLSSDTYETIGEPIVEVDNQMIGNNSRVMSIRKTVPNCSVAQMIGQSVAVSSQNRENSSDNRILTAGVLARASTIDENKKQFCSCSGKTLWEERREQQKRSDNQ